jgi:hypothetical protein
LFTVFRDFVTPPGIVRETWKLKSEQGSVERNIQVDGENKAAVTIPKVTIALGMATDPRPGNG